MAPTRGHTSEPCDNARVQVRFGLNRALTEEVVGVEGRGSLSATCLCTGRSHRGPTGQTTLRTRREEWTEKLGLERELRARLP